MDKFHFTKITLKLSDTRNSIIVSGYEVNITVAFSDLGLTNADNTTPNVLAVVFWKIARGEFHESDYKNKTSKRRLTSLSAAFKEAFGTKDKPFLKGVPRFNIKNPSKVLAEEKARGRSAQFNEGFHSPTHNQTPDEDTNKWLEENDSGFKKPSSNYYPPDDK